MKKKDNILYSHIMCSSWFSQEEIDKIQTLADKHPLKRGRVGINAKTISLEEVEKVRISDIKYFFRNDVTILETEWIFQKIDNLLTEINQTYFGFDLYPSNSFQYTTYDSALKGRYDWHMDSFLNGFPVPEEWGTNTRKLSISVFLNDDYEGGDFQLALSNQETPKTFRGAPGDAIIFPSFLTHRVTPVTKGIRKSLVVWNEGPSWK